MKIKNICFVSGGGGHLTELLSILDAVKDKNKFLITYGKYNIIKNKFKKNYFVKPFGYSVKDLLIGIIKTIYILLKEKPQVIISAGGETTILFFYLGKLLLGSKLIYIESAAQVYNPSITGRIVYPVTDIFLVQWNSLLKKYGKKAKYVGGLIG